LTFYLRELCQNKRFFPLVGTGRQYEKFSFIDKSGENIGLPTRSWHTAISTNTQLWPMLKLRLRNVKLSNNYQAGASNRIKVLLP
jgi:hypothetical protein